MEEGAYQTEVNEREASEDDLEYEEELAQLFESRAALRSAQEENHELHEKYEKLRNAKNRIAAMEEKRENQKRLVRLQSENERMQREIASMEEDVFKGNAIGFIDTLAKVAYVTFVEKEESRDGREGYFVSSESTQQRDEMSTFWEADRLFIRPWNHNEINVSVPVTYLCRPWLKDGIPVQLHNKCSFNTLEENKKDFGLCSTKKVRGRIQRTPVTPADRIRFKDSKYKLRGLS